MSPRRASRELGAAAVLAAGVLVSLADPTAPRAAPASSPPTSSSAPPSPAPSSTKGKRMPRTVFMSSPQNPLVAIRLYFDVGSAEDPPGKEGLAALTSDVVGQGGTQKRTYAEVLDALYPLAARIQVIGDKESIVFEGTVHRDNLATFADLIAEQVLTPRFSEDDFTRHRQNALDYVAKSLRGNNDEELGKQTLGTLLYANGHPYGHPTTGTIAGLNAITLDDVRAFYARHYTRDRLVVGVGGGFPDGFAPAFAARFAALPEKGPPRPRLPAPAPRRGAEVVLVEKEARANAISVGYPCRSRAPTRTSIPSRWRARTSASTGRSTACS